MKYRAPADFHFTSLPCALTYYASFLLRLDANLDACHARRVLADPAVCLADQAGVSYRLDCMHGWWRYVGMSDLLDISKASFVSSCIFFCSVEAVLRLADIRAR